MKAIAVKVDKELLMKLLGWDSSIGIVSARDSGDSIEFLCTGEGLANTNHIPLYTPAYRTGPKAEFIRFEEA